nr:hypothetical protein [Kibdelosporangium sp. MJ126-NF4]CTQ89722.1 hypothetical protein [Kibdelosporangium sp. MJ126-NF4]
MTGQHGGRADRADRIAEDHLGQLLTGVFLILVLRSPATV